MLVLQETLPSTRSVAPLHPEYSSRCPSSTLFSPEHLFLPRVVLLYLATRLCSAAPGKCEHHWSEGSPGTSPRRGTACCNKLQREAGSHRTRTWLWSFSAKDKTNLAQNVAHPWALRRDEMDGRWRWRGGRGQGKREKGRGGEKKKGERRKGKEQGKKREREGETWPLFSKASWTMEKTDLQKIRVKYAVC